MNTNERNEILRLLAEGKISASEAISLLDATEPAESAESLKAAESASDSYGESAIEAFKAQGDQESDPFNLKITEDDLVVTKAGNGQKPQWLKIRVRNLETGRNKVNISLPFGLVNFGLGIARRFGVMDGEDEAMQIWELLRNGERGVLVDVEDEEDNEHVQIYLE